MKSSEEAFGGTATQGGRSLDELNRSVFCADGDGKSFAVVITALSACGKPLVNKCLHHDQLDVKKKSSETQLLLSTV